MLLIILGVLCLGGGIILMTRPTIVNGVLKILLKPANGPQIDIDFIYRLLRMFGAFISFAGLFILNGQLLG